MVESSSVLIGCGFAIVGILLYITGLFRTIGTLWTMHRFVENLPERVKNLHHNTEKMIDLRGYRDLVTTFGDKKARQEDFDILSATVRRLWKELGEERTLHVTTGSIHCD